MKQPDCYQLASKQFKQLQSWRRQIHRFPELGFQEKKTAQLVATVCRQAGWQVQTGVARTGVVAVLGPPKSKRVVAIRADMDALPIQEQSRHAYRSQVPQVMHACGHDGNVTLALGAAVLLGSLKKSLNGQVKLIFQPCEENPPGGAQAMIAAGALSAPKPDMIIAGHMDAQLPVKTIASKPGVIMANVGSFRIKVHGQGGHGAMPHCCVDPVVISAQIVTNLQQLVSREANPLAPQVVSIGRICGGSAYNVIADDVILEGTIRSLTKQERRLMPKQIKRIASSIAAAHRGHVTCEFEHGHPALVNDPQVTKAVMQAGAHLFGPRGVIEFKQPAMSGEDFTYYAQEVPACFFHVGAGFEDQRKNYPWHHPRFDFDERGLVAGTALLAHTALTYLK